MEATVDTDQITSGTKTKTGKWEGGFTRRDVAGRTVFVIRKMIRGKRFVVSTRARSEGAAVAQLRRFEADPEAFDPRGVAKRDPVYVTAVQVQGWREWAEAKGNSPGHVKGTVRYLLQWRAKLKGVDLRRLSLSDHVNPALEGATSRDARIRALKCLMGWLRKEQHTISLAEDATADLHARAARPEQWQKSKVIPRDHYLVARERIGAPWEDALDVLASTGWHVRELTRFCANGRIEPLPAGRADGCTWALVSPLHKSGAPARAAVVDGIAEAGRRLLLQGKAISPMGLHRAIAKACAVKPAIPRFNAGAFRHSVASWAIEAGAAPAAVAAFLQHKSASTTMRFYSTNAVPPRVPGLADVLPLRPVKAG